MTGTPCHSGACTASFPSDPSRRHSCPTLPVLRTAYGIPMVDVFGHAILVSLSSMQSHAWKAEVAHPIPATKHPSTP